MAIGFVTINIIPGREYEVYNKLVKISQIIELHPLFGEYDLIAKIEAEDYESFGQIIIKKIRTVDDIIDTKTLIGISSPLKQQS